MILRELNATIKLIWMRLMTKSEQIQQQFKELQITPTQSLQGTYQTPSDKSISHRALIFGAIAKGQTVINRLLPAADVLRTKTALQQLGVKITTTGEQTTVEGQGGFKFKQPQQPLNLGNSGTTTRLFLGLLAKQDFPITLVGDASLSQRPMARVVTPLQAVGMKVNYLNEFDQLPLTILPNQHLQALNYQMPIASAQLKSALILAALQADQPSKIGQLAESRNHTELMLTQFGGNITEKQHCLQIQPLTQPLIGQTLTVPGDPSTAAFLITATLLLPNSRLTVTNHSLNPTRTGFLQLLEAQHTPLTYLNKTTAGEPSADIQVENLITPLKAFTINQENLGRLIDEIPIISLLATQAVGTTLIRDAQELRYKETDRLHVVATELTKFGAIITELPDGLQITGPTQLKRPSVPLDAHQDHRIAMMLVIAELLIGEKLPIAGIESIAISNPTFIKDLISLLKDENK